MQNIGDLTTEEVEGWTAPEIRRSKPVYFCQKRFFDIVFSLVALVVLFPLYLIISIAIKIEEPRGSVILGAQL